MRKRNDKAGRSAPQQRRPAAADDDRNITALKLKPEELTPEMAAYFAKCEAKLGFVPNVLRAYTFDMPKLSAFVAMYNDLMLAPSGLSKLEREMIAVAFRRITAVIIVWWRTGRRCGNCPAIRRSANSWS